MLMIVALDLFMLVFIVNNRATVKITINQAFNVSLSWNLPRIWFDCLI